MYVCVYMHAFGARGVFPKHTQSSLGCLEFFASLLLILFYFWSRTFHCSLSLPILVDWLANEFCLFMFRITGTWCYSVHLHLGARDSTQVFMLTQKSQVSSPAFPKFWGGICRMKMFVFGPHHFISSWLVFSYALLLRSVRLPIYLIFKGKLQDTCFYRIRKWEEVR